MTRGPRLVWLRLARLALVAGAGSILWTIGQAAPSAQTAPSAPPVRPAEPAAPASPASLARIREALKKEPAIDLRTDLPVFRTEVEAHVIKLAPYWKDESTAVASYVQSAIPLAHREHLQNIWGMTGNTGRLPFEAANNPVQFVTTPIFPTMDAGALVSVSRLIDEARKRRERRQARQRVNEQLKALEQSSAPAPGQKPDR